MIEAVVRAESGLIYGMFRFSVLPRLGDRITLSNHAGGSDVLDVLYTEHLPVEVQPTRLGNTDPVVTVVVELFRHVAEAHLAT